jgi:glutamate formiminotransferase
MRFLTQEQAKYIGENFELPVYVYSERELNRYADEFLNFPSAF